MARRNTRRVQYSMANVALIIFDLDGTLVDTSEDLAASLNFAVTPLGIEALSVAETVALVGEGLSRLIEKILEPLGLMEYCAITMKKFLEHYSVHLTDKSKPYPGVAKSLESLKKSGVAMAVLSNKREDLSRRLLDALGLAGYFALIAGSDTVPEKKPSPEAVRFVLRKFGCEPADALMVGDSSYDIEAARNAGVKVAAAAWGFRARETLSGADYLIESMEDLFPVLGLRA
jgi:phosphoglycolate phosphatase